MEKREVPIKQLTLDFDLHWAQAVELRHALDFWETNFSAICKHVFFVCPDHSRVILK